jgi:acetoin utilization protein AcuB
MVAKELVSNTVMPLFFTDSIKQAMGIMSFYHLRQLPVVDKQKFIGIVDEEDLLNFNQEDLIESLVDSAAVRKIATQEDQHLYEVMQLLVSQKISMIPVIDAQEKYLGIITREDILQYFTEFSSIAEPGCILVLTVKKRDYSLSEIARIVESENGSILSTNIHNLLDTELIEVTIKINKQEINRIVSTFIRYNYTIKASYSENDYHHLLQERFDHLMNYLNV